MESRESCDEAINWLYDLQYFGMKLGLSNTLALLSEIGNPHRKFRSVHVAGTNGKGSVCAFLTNILKESGLKVGTYTSPHLEHFGERIAVNGFPMTRSEVLRSIAQIKPKVEMLAKKGVQCTFFEVTTCMAFRHFARRNIDIAVVEVGMGGRLDSTNVITPELSIITEISIEHAQHLGGTLEKIAGEKAGIIKKGVPTVTSASSPGALAVIEARCGKMKSKLYKLGDNVKIETKGRDILGSDISLKLGSETIHARIKLPGRHQTANAAAAALSARILGVGDIHIQNGLASTRWPGRLQVVRRNPTVILDSTHNPGGAEALVRFLQEQNIRPVLVIGMLADKEVGPAAASLEPLADKIIVTQSSYERRMEAKGLAGHFSRNVEVIADLEKAIVRAFMIADNKNHVLITGSIFTASDALHHLDVIRINEMMDILEEVHGIGAYPGRNPETDGPPPPGSEDPFRVLISTILSQRTKDGNTHLAAEALFSRFDTPDKIASASPEDIEPLIRPAGFYKQKALKVIQTSRILHEKYGSRVPDTLEELTALPGVGRKTANCVLAYGFGLPAIAVDTHVHRISNLLGLVKTGAPDDTEDILLDKVPKERWHDINRLLVRHGQSICGPAKPKCEICPISHLCDYGIQG